MDFERVFMLMSICEKSRLWAPSLNSLHDVAMAELGELNDTAKEEIAVKAKAVAEEKAKEDAKVAAEAKAKADAEAAEQERLAKTPTRPQPQPRVDAPRAIPTQHSPGFFTRDPNPNDDMANDRR